MFQITNSYGLSAEMYLLFQAITAYVSLVSLHDASFSGSLYKYCFQAILNHLLEYVSKEHTFARQTDKKKDLQIILRNMTIVMKSIALKCSCIGTALAMSQYIPGVRFHKAVSACLAVKL